MKKHAQPFDVTNSTNPWLINLHKNNLAQDPATGACLSAEYIWSHKQSDRDELVKRVFDYYKSKSFEDLFVDQLSEEELIAEYSKIKAADEHKCMVDRKIKNSSSVGTDILKHFCGSKFYSAKGSGKSSHSCREVFENDEKFLEVLRNRMGYRSTKEDGTERPYVFAISDKMILQGMRSSGLAYTVSTFKPVVAKFIYSHWGKGTRVFDPSCGWGARALGAGALGMEYWGTDPLTSNEVQGMMNFFGIKGQTIAGGSEDESSYSKIVDSGLGNKFDFSFTSPPYFDLEIYSDDQTQSVKKYSAYDNWINVFWRGTVKNVRNHILSDDGIFGLITVEKVKKHNLAEDMVEACLEEGLVIKEFVPWSTTKSHLSGKAKTKDIKKYTEGIYLFSKI